MKQLRIARLVSVQNKTVRVYRDNLECMDKHLDLGHPVVRFQVLGSNIAVLLDNGALCVVSVDMQIVAKTALRTRGRSSKRINFRDLNPIAAPETRTDHKSKLLAHGFMCADAFGKYVGVVESSEFLAIYCLESIPGTYKTYSFPKSLRLVALKQLAPWTASVQLVELGTELLIWSASYTSTPPLSKKSLTSQQSSANRMVESGSALPQKQKSDSKNANPAKKSNKLGVSQANYKPCPDPELRIELKQVGHDAGLIGETTLRIDPIFVCFNLGAIGNGVVFGPDKYAVIRLADLDVSVSKPVQVQPIPGSEVPPSHQRFFLSHPREGATELYRRTDAGEQELVNILVKGSRIQTRLILDKVTVADLQDDMTLHRDEKIPNYLRAQLQDHIAILDTQEQCVVSSLKLKPTCIVA